MHSLTRPSERLRAPHAFVASDARKRAFVGGVELGAEVETIDTAWRPGKLDGTELARLAVEEGSMALAEQHKLSPLTWAAIVLTVIGALNWGLVGLFDFNLVAAIFGSMSTLSRIIYVIVALAGIYLIIDAARLRETTRERRHVAAV